MLSLPSQVRLLETQPGSGGSPGKMTITPMPETVLIHAAYATWRKPTLVTLARAAQLKAEGHEVLLTYCAARSGTCAINYVGNPLTCAICRTGIRSTAERMGIETIPLDVDAAAHEPLPLTERKQLVEGVQSGLVSTFRFLSTDMARLPFLGAIKRRYYENSKGLLSALKTVLRERRPGRVEVFNGRHACSKALLIAAKSAGLSFGTMEVTSQKTPILFEGHTIFDRRRLQERMLSNDADLDAAEAYFSSRRSSRVNKFAKKHRRAFVPPDTTGFRKTVGFFLSSQDEFEALGKDWRSSFADNARVVSEAATRNPDLLFCVRFHPHQADMGSDVVTPFARVAELENVRLYHPRNPVNTHGLMDWVDLVVTFGSTITVEACWRGKPVVLLGPSLHDQLDVAYTPASMEAFLELLKGDLVAKPRINAARYVKYLQFDDDPLPNLVCANHDMRPVGFRRVRPFLTYLARYMDLISCHALKALFLLRLRTGSRERRPLVGSAS